MRVENGLRKGHQSSRTFGMMEIALFTLCYVQNQLGHFILSVRRLHVIHKVKA